MTKKLLRIAEFSQRIGRSPSTIRRWEKQGLITPSRTTTGQRYFTEQDVQAATRLPAPAQASTVAYLRASAAAHEDLAMQRQAVTAYATSAGISVDEWHEEAGGGLDYNRPRLLSLIERAAAGERITLIVAHKDRLARFGADLIEHIIVRSGGHVVSLNVECSQAEKESDFHAAMRSFEPHLRALAAGQTSEGVES